jgi:hypothetical protein
MYMFAKAPVDDVVPSNDLDSGIGGSFLCFRLVALLRIRISDGRLLAILFYD